MSEGTKQRKGAREANESTRQSLLLAAREAFVAGGLEGARVDDIALRAGSNKQLVYHYFGSKDGLYTAVLEQVYQEIREQEAALHLDMFPAEEAMRKLIEFSFDYLRQSPGFVRLLVDENIHFGRHLKETSTVREMNRPVIDLIAQTLERGVADGVFRRGLDPLHVYLSIAGMSFFYFANIHTLSRAFSRNLEDEAEMEARKAHIVDFALNAIRVRSDGGALP
ncbi:TetR/AcrR family transcriptional regulator [Pseudohoeflea coraliihabitans]|uniref:TetR family transcriptional regulator n=1 Tax=Pseudohoeflea coraliihabitans TaxID=2860393 RepID=A0ABS6WT73_9HYPH|nr:TetR/AcrR family transcriptional regulator [Pseudohoeflea sp. DP4N28-3]MBW3098990.1 TetR family transcriptional regulator [Pseudohoeflea sp. DP4N28-3]